MNNSLLLSILKNFDKQQLKDFSSFVKSPYFNTNKALISLTEYIRKQHPEFSEQKLEKEFVYRKIFGKSVYNDGFFRVLMSNLQTLAEEYISISKFRNDPLMMKKYIIDGAASIPASRKFSERVLKEGLRESEKKEPTGPDDFLAKYFMAFYRKYFFSTNFSPTKQNKPTEEMYDEQKFLIYFFVLRMLADHFYHLNQSQIINYDPKLLFLDEIIQFLENNPEYLGFPTLNMAYLRVLLLKNNRIEDLYRLKNAFYASADKLGTKDSFNIISIIINYCSKNFLMTENEIYLNEKLEILLFGLDKGINAFDDGDYFDVFRFHNIFSTLLECGRTVESEEFVKQYGKSLDPSEMNFWINYANADISHRKGEYDKALGYLANVKTLSSVTNKFAFRTLQLKVFYDAGHFEQAFSAADSFRHFIQKDTVLTPNTIEQYRNFYSAYIKLLNLKQKAPAGQINELNEQKNVMHKKWLIKKFEEKS